jgi:hypothetical protein
MKIYLFKVKDWEKILLGQRNEEDKCFFVQRGNGEKYKYEDYRIVWSKEIYDINEEFVECLEKENNELEKICDTNCSENCIKYFGCIANNIISNTNNNENDNLCKCKIYYHFHAQYELDENICEHCGKRIKE